MKNSFLVSLLLLILLCGTSSLRAAEIRKIDREHWKKAKRGLRYDPSGKNENFNKNWSDQFDKGTKRDGKGGFGKYSRDNNGSGGGTSGYEGNQGKQTEKEEADIELPRVRIPEVSIAPVNLSWLSYLLIGIGVAAFLFILYRIISKLDLKKNKKVVATSFEEQEEEQIDATELPKTELELRLEAALKNKDFREAVRIWFIFIIKGLRERNKIKWEKKKTNSSYLIEMQQHPAFNDFSSAVLLFEMIWYGKREIAQNEYQSIEPLFRRLLRQIENENTAVR